MIKKEFWKNDKLATDGKSLDEILVSISELPEVKKKDHYLDSLTSHQRHISLRIIESPGINKPYCVIAAGDDSKIRFETYYNFYVWPKTMTIKYLDTYTGKIISLREWRASPRHS